MAVVPNPKTWIAGETVKAADMNLEVRDAINFLVGPPLTVLRQVGADPIPDDTQTELSWDLLDIDRDQGWSISQPTRYVAQTNGWYAVTASVGLAADATGFRYVSFLVNSSFHVSGNRNAPPASGKWIGTASASIHLDVSEWVEVSVHHDAGVALNTVPGDTRFTIQFISF